MIKKIPRPIPSDLPAAATSLFRPPLAGLLALAFGLTLASTFGQQITYQVSSSWTEGFGADITIINNTAQPLNNWQLTFTSDRTISSIWNASISSHTGNAYTVIPANWNTSIAPGSSVDVGFNASPAPGANALTAFAVTTTAGSSSSPTPTPTPAPPAATGIQISPGDGTSEVDQITIPLNTNTVLNLAPAGTYTVATNNADPASATISGTTLTVRGLKAGRTGLALTNTTTNQVRYLGVRVRNADGTLPGLPPYLGLGSVSEDTTADLNFWHAYATGSENRRMDFRYIYLPGGPVNGWTTWSATPGGRVTSFVRESLRMGMIPVFVWYNIPDSSEGYLVDKQHAQDPTYMQEYFTTLKLALDLARQEAGDETVGFLLEPDFLGYLSQNGEDPTTLAASTSSVYTSGVLTASDPQFPNTVRGLVEAINYTIAKYLPNAWFGWQFNLWASRPGGYFVGPPVNGLMHLTDTMGVAAGRAAINQEASGITNFYKNAGVLTYGASFVSIDKYGLDGAYDGNAQNPSQSVWFWNAVQWTNYLTFVNAMHVGTSLPVVLWQLPVGHINSSLTADPYNNGLFPDLDNSVMHYEDSAPTYFFGDSFNATGARNTFFAQSDGVARVTPGTPTITWGSHLDLAAQSGVTVALFGAGVGASTSSVGSPPTDSDWWITKAQNYYRSPVVLGGSSPTPTPVPTPTPKPTPTPTPVPTPTPKPTPTPTPVPTPTPKPTPTPTPVPTPTPKPTPTPTPVPSGQIKVSQQIVNSWGSGMEVALTVTNTGSTTLQTWSFQFDYPSTIGDFWNGTLSAGSPHRYRIQPASWNAQLAPGQSTSVGFIAAPGNTSASLQNLTTP